MHIREFASVGLDRAFGAPDPAHVGAGLRALRLSAGLSQRELANRTGLAHGTISFIERGRVSPSVASLARLLAEFQLTIRDFFHAVESHGQPIFFRADALPEFFEGERSFRLVGNGAGGSLLQLHHEHYAPGSDTGAAPYSHEGEEAGVVVRGELEVIVAGRQETLRAGDAYQFPSRLPHRFRNPAREACEVVSVCTPPFLSAHPGGPHGRP